MDSNRRNYGKNSPFADVGHKWNTKEFVKLQKEWYEKLKKLGFVDLEFFLDNGNTTPQLLKGSIYNLKNTYKPATAYYYQKACWYAHHGTFEDTLEKSIWELHAEGKTNLQVAKALRTTVSIVVTRIRKARSRMLADPTFDKAEAALIQYRQAEFERKVLAHNLRKKPNGEGK